MSSEEALNLIMIIIGSIKYMHIGSLKSLDDALISDPKKSIHELIF